MYIVAMTFLPKQAAAPAVRISLLLALLLLCTCPPAGAQQDIFFQHLTVKEGLSQGSIMCMLQDRKGFMWFGTQDGLNRYDGYEFRIFKHDPANTASINENFILFIAEDKDGVMWFGTLSNPDVLNRFDPITETFTSVPRKDVDLRGARIGQSKSSCTDPAGVEWLRTPAAAWRAPIRSRDQRRSLPTTRRTPEASPTTKSTRS